MKYTTNYKLNKPELTDMPDITKLSDNMDTLDAKLKEVADRTGLASKTNTGIVRIGSGISVTDTGIISADIPAVMTGATASSAGTRGLVPAPTTGDQTKSLTGAGSWIAHLPLAGGTMSGDIKYGDDFYIANDSEGDYTNMDIGWDFVNAKGAGVGLRSIAHETQPGYFSIWAKDSKNNSGLNGTPAGVLTWGGTRVVVGTAGSASQPVYVNSSGTPVVCTMATYNTAGILRQTSQSLASSNAGYIELNSGLKIQWGQVGTATDKDYTVTFSMAFTNIPVVTLGIGAWTDDPAYIAGLSKTQVRIHLNSDTSSQYVRWIAIGR